jgi:hypothetical protein
MKIIIRENIYFISIVGIEKDILNLSILYYNIKNVFYNKACE